MHDIGGSANSNKIDRFIASPIGAVVIWAPAAGAVWFILSRFKTADVSKMLVALAVYSLDDKTCGSHNGTPLDANQPSSAGGLSR